MNPLVCGPMLVRFPALELWLMASVCLVLQISDWMRVRAATPESLDEKYFVAAGDHWLNAAIVLGLLGVLVCAGMAPLTPWLAGGHGPRRHRPHVPDAAPTPAWICSRSW